MRKKGEIPIIHKSYKLFWHTHTPNPVIVVLVVLQLMNIIVMLHNLDVVFECFQWKELKQKIGFVFERLLALKGYTKGRCKTYLFSCSNSSRRRNTDKQLGRFNLTSDYNQSKSEFMKKFNHIHIVVHMFVSFSDDDTVCQPILWV